MKTEKTTKIFAFKKYGKELKCFFRDFHPSSIKYLFLKSDLLTQNSDVTLDMIYQI